MGNRFTVMRLTFFKVFVLFYILAAASPSWAQHLEQQAFDTAMATQTRQAADKLKRQLADLVTPSAVPENSAETQQPKTTPVMPQTLVDRQAIQLAISQAHSQRDAKLWKQAQGSLAGLERYQARCWSCRPIQRLAQARATLPQRQAAWQRDRAACHQAAAPQQYGGQHRWDMNAPRSRWVCRMALAATPQDPWLPYLVWRTSPDAQRNQQLLDKAAKAQVPPALADKAAQLARQGQMASALRLAQQAAALGDWGGISLVSILDQTQPLAARMDALRPLAHLGYPWACRALASLDVPSRKAEWLMMAANAGDPDVRLALAFALEHHPQNTAQAWDLQLGLMQDGDKAVLAAWQNEGHQRPKPMVFALQNTLIAAGLLQGPADGVWGPQTLAAFLQAQQNGFKLLRP